MATAIYQMVWGRFPRGSGPEEAQFEIRSGAPVGTSAFLLGYEFVGVDGDAGLDDVFHRWNAGSGMESSAFRAAECRSLSPGDVVVTEGRAYQVAPIGYEERPCLAAYLGAYGDGRVGGPHGPGDLALGAYAAASGSRRVEVA